MSKQREDELICRRATNDPLSGNKQEEINYMTITSTRCDCCGAMVDSFSDRSEWFGKYLKPKEDKICRNCIKDRPGYAEEFKEKIGMSMEVLNAN